jgi:hypothetical protein
MAAGFLFRLETPEGTPAEPPSIAVAIPNMRAGDTIPLGGRTLRVVRVRDDDAAARAESAYSPRGRPCVFVGPGPRGRK